jgi:hypothetical protein
MMMISNVTTATYFSGLLNLFALGVAFSYYSSYAQRIHEGRATMPADVLRLRFPTFLFAALCLIIVATSPALSQDRQSTKQSRPRRVSPQTNTEQNNQIID